MKKIITAFSLSALCVLAMHADVNDNKPHRLLMEMSAGVNHFDSDSRLSKDNAGFYGLRATIFDSVVDKYGFQVAYEGAFGVDYERLQPKEKSQSDVHRILGNVVIDGDQEVGITPYLFLGAGYEYLSDEIKGEVSQGIADLGIGFRYGLGYGLRVGLEGKVLGKFDSHDLDYELGVTFGYALNHSDESNSFTPVSSVLPTPTTEHVVKSSTVVHEINLGMNHVPFEESTSTTVAQDEVSAEVTPVEQEVAPSAYYVQLAAYAKTNPEKMVNKAKSHGFENVDVIGEESRIGTLQRVVVGPYESKSEAKNALRKIKEMVPKAYIVKL